MMLAWIIPVETGGHPEHPIYNPPGIWPSPGVPTHPIYNPPYPSQGPGFPTHPIAPGGPPPSIWPSPGHPSHPIYNPPFPSQGPGFPTHPIAPGGLPPGIWGGPPNYPDQGLPGSQPGVGNPINRPPTDNDMWKQVYIPGVGWIWAMVPPAVPSNATPDESQLKETGE
jgi:hypothetical protein